VTDTLPYPGGQIINAAMARALHADACRGHAAVAWVVLWDLPAYPKRYATRLATSGSASSPYLMLADSLTGIRDLLPSAVHFMRPLLCVWWRGCWIWTIIP
jgi:hypothetical protein